MYFCFYYDQLLKFGSKKSKTIMNILALSPNTISEILRYIEYNEKGQYNFILAHQHEKLRTMIELYPETLILGLGETIIQKGILNIIQFPWIHTFTQFLSVLDFRGITVGLRYDFSNDTCINTQCLRKLGISKYMPKVLVNTLLSSSIEEIYHDNDLYSPLKAKNLDMLTVARKCICNGGQLRRLFARICFETQQNILDFLGALAYRHEIGLEIIDLRDLHIDSPQLANEYARMYQLRKTILLNIDTKEILCNDSIFSAKRL